MAIFGYFWANSFLVVKSKQCKHQSNVWNMFKVDNRHQNDIIDIFGRNMRGNIRSTKEKKTAKKKKKHSVGTNSSKSSILLQSCYLWKRNCKLMKIENGFLPVSLPISKIFLKMLRLHDTLYEKKTLELFVMQVQLTIMFFIRMSFG